MANLEVLTNLRSTDMKPQSTFSPISLRYIAALRGNKPRKTGTEFTYAQAACTSPESLICLAASNPEGRFYGLVADDAARRTAEEIATQRGTYNVIFLTGTPTETLSRINKGSALPPMLDFLCCDENAANLSADDHLALLDIAQKRLKPSGILALSYTAYDREDGALRFLVQEIAPEMDDRQKQDFLLELNKLGRKYFTRHPELATRLTSAIAKGAPQDFFSAFDGATSNAATFTTKVAAQERDFIYGGDAEMAANFVELAVAKEAQDLIVSCRNSPLYEVIKDFALDRALRTDLWVKAPMDMSNDPAELFGGFAYGLTVSRDEVPGAFNANGTVIDLMAPAYVAALDAMAVMPVGVGDVMTQASAQGLKPEAILDAMQILVACGFANPMRGVMNAINCDNVSQPRLVGSYNRYLDKTELNDKDVLLSSQVAGCALSFSAREAFVMQAVNRVGLKDSVSALMPELTRLSNTPASQTVINANEATPEIAHDMVVDVIGKSLPQWYAMALLEAA